ncbi:response regulator [Saccharibacillus sp. JS10]|uniref:GGDEF domain-containing response regulator n=1 Tax=Saccharibacillus sp. JS10 TaxID=2950552 RepID=UPI00210B1D37|nr:response regulator [Saccharibacillus sp. JS10]MCQ4087420.1 response regulator [Saccharibacillus sp. JS10]
MNKYQKLFIDQTGSNLDKLLSPTARSDERSVYRMLHSIKGTSGTIGLQTWYNASLRLITEFSEHGDRVFTGEELAGQLSQLSQLLAEEKQRFADEEAEISSTEIMDSKESSASEASKAQDESSSSQALAEPPAKSESSEGTVLLLDDDLSLLALLKDVLEEQGFTVFATPRFDKAVEWFYEMRPDCAVLDVLLPEQSGFELMEQLRELCDTYMIPVVLITGKTDKATRLHAYENGADDFLTKPIDPEEFVVRIRRLTRRRSRLTGQLLLDQTTGAYGMSFLERELTRQIDSDNESREPFALAAVELDGLRQLNERTGYREGDRVLRAFSDKVRNRLRPQDIWARDRANRFYLLQPGLGSEQSTEFLQTILASERIKSVVQPNDVSPVYGVIDVEYGKNRQQALAGALQALEQNAGRHSSNGNEGSSSEGAPRQLRLAIIDDDPLIRTILERQLENIQEEFGAEFRSFSDGEEFLSDPWHREHARYLLILDRMMPRMNGMEVLSRLRSGNYDSVYTVLMLTGVGDELGIAEAIRAGTDDYMTKPFSMIELEARVRRLLGKVEAML